MKARSNPSNKQMLRRLKETPERRTDPRLMRDPYHALRFQGYSHAYAKRALRDVPPAFIRHEVNDDISSSDLEPAMLLVSPGFSSVRMEVEVRPLLSAHIAERLAPRDKEYTVWDDTLCGFGVRVRASGAKSYIYLGQRRKGQKLKKYTIGRVGRMSFEEARATALDYSRQERGSNEDDEVFD